ncbi:hypothetical protein SUGI_0040870 [Cryptomeria japonica]|nr:hypothetical protein SUGI_0040870 [Cryptomeria japonica]
MLFVEEIIGCLLSPSPNIDFLSRTLSFLATRGIFSQMLLPNSPIKYDLAPISKWPIKGTDNGGEKEGTFAPFLLLHTHEAVIIPWYRLGENILFRSSFLFQLVHKKLLFSLIESNPELGKLFNEAIVISKAPIYAGVQYIVGNMFVSVPNADAIFMKA